MNIIRAFKLFSLFRGLAKSDFESVAGLMGEMHGLPQKLGQHFTLYPGYGQRDYFDSLCTTSREENVDLDHILKELGIKSKNAEICAQASIGQVYRVETDHEILAVKVRYPGLEERVKSDFRLLKMLFWPTRLTPLRNNMILSLIDNLSTLILREFDYGQEARIQGEFSKIFAKDAAIMVPQIKTNNELAIVSEWVDGQNLSECDGLGQWFIDGYLRFILQSLKKLGMVHADPHPGNFLIYGTPPKLAVLDFGAVVNFTLEETQAVIRLLSGEYNNEPELVQDLEVLGVNREVLAAYAPIVGDLVSILLEPFYYPGEYDFSTWRLQYKLNTLMASRTWEKPFELPPKLLLLLRTLQGIYYYARINFVRFNWNEAVRKYTR